MYISENCNWTPYGTDPRKDRLVDSRNENVRREAAESGYGLDKLVYDKDWYVRNEVARQGYGLDILVKDKDWHIRKEVAEHGYGLDILVNDSVSFVREEVAKHGYGLDILVNDEDRHVREEVAKHGYGLDKLVNDKEPEIRTIVAKHGYGLDILVNDKSYEVREIVARQGYGLDKLVYDREPFVRSEVVEHGYGLDILVNDEDRYVRNAAAEYLKNAGYTNIFDWTQDHPDKVCRTSNSIMQMQILREFIDKADQSNRLAVQTSCGSIDEFFNDAHNADNDPTLTICAADTKNIIVKLQKTVADNRTKFIFIVDITSTDGDTFTINSVIISQKQLNSLIRQTAEILRVDRQLSKYADDLEDCLYVYAAY